MAPPFPPDDGITAEQDNAPLITKVQLPSEDDEDIQQRAARNVRRLLSTGPDEMSEADTDVLDLDKHALFCQMDVLSEGSDSDRLWREEARWLKYEEQVEEGERWSKPHVAMTSLHALLRVQSAISGGTVLLDVDGIDSIEKFAEHVSYEVTKNEGLQEEAREKLHELLMRPHKHQHRSHVKANKSAHKKDELSAKHCTTGSYAESNGKAVQNGSNHFPMQTAPTAEPLSPYRPNKKMVKKVTSQCEAANILVGDVDFVSQPIAVLVRLSDNVPLGDMTEVALVSRFVFIVLVPKEGYNLKEYLVVGRAMASLFSDRVFCEVAYAASSTQDILAGVEEYILSLSVLPSSVWDPSNRLMPPTTTRTVAAIKTRLDVDRQKQYDNVGDELHDELEKEEDCTLKRTGKLFGGLWLDIKRRYPLYKSDILDGLHLQCLASTFFLYFACVTPIITFGGVLSDYTGGNMGVMECLVGGAICGIIYSLFSGQPLTLLGTTGPNLVLQAMLYNICTTYEWDFLSFRFWVGLWTCVILLVIVAFDLSAYVRYITRFTEESFAVLISLIFIKAAATKLMSIWHTHPPFNGFTCWCSKPLGGVVNATFDNMDLCLESIDRDCFQEEKVRVEASCLSQHECEVHGWTLEGAGCVHATTSPEVFYFSCLLFIGTLTISLMLRAFKDTGYFPTTVRRTIGDFAVVIAIMVCSGLDYWTGIPTPKLIVEKQQPHHNHHFHAPNSTYSEMEDWLVDPLEVSHWWLTLLAVPPAIVVVILIFLDQQITTVIINRKEHKLKKGVGYHLDLLIVALLVLVCSLFGLPWYVAATVRALTHVKSLMVEEPGAPGEKPTFIGVREQRVTNLLVHVLIALSILLKPVLQFVPMAVLYGLFMYMGVTSLGGVQFVDRVKILLMPSKYQPDYPYLRHVRAWRVHLFTVIQLILMVMMWTVKSVNAIAIAFPIMLVVLCVARKLMDFYFSQKELFWLDHLLPGHKPIISHSDAKKGDETQTKGKKEEQHEA